MLINSQIHDKSSNSRPATWRDVGSVPWIKFMFGKIETLTPEQKVARSIIEKATKETNNVVDSSVSPPQPSPTSTPELPNVTNNQIGEVPISKVIGNPSDSKHFKRTIGKNG